MAKELPIVSVNYDSDGDCLYVHFANGPATYAELPTGDILRWNPETGEILGITIPFPSRRFKLTA